LQQGIFGILGTKQKWDHNQSFDTEEKAFSSVSHHFIPAYRRERGDILEIAARKQLSTDLQPGDNPGDHPQPQQLERWLSTLEQMPGLVSIRDLNTLSSVITARAHFMPTD